MCSVAGRLREATLFNQVRPTHLCRLSSTAPRAPTTHLIRALMLRSIVGWKRLDPLLAVSQHLQRQLEFMRLTLAPSLVLLVLSLIALQLPTVCLTSPR